MRIAIVSNSSWGLVDFRSELIRRLMQEHQVCVAVSPDSKMTELRALGCEIIETPVDCRGVNPLRDLKLFACYRRLLRRIRPDLVITYTIKPNIYGGMACRLNRIPYAVNVTGLGTAFQKKGLLRAMVTLMYRTVLKKAKTVFFENEADMEMLAEKKVVQREKCVALPGAGVNLERFAPADYPAEEQETRFLFMGRIMREKGVDELLLAMRRLREENIACSLDVLGSFEEHYEDEFRVCSEAGWLRFYGYQQEVRPFIENCHCFVLPSWHEGMANTNLECAAMARPLITSRIPGCREALIENESGFLCRARDADSLYEAMKRFCALPWEEKRQMGLAGRKHMEAVFDKEKVVEATLKGLGI